MLSDGGAVAEWSKALLVSQNKQKPNDPRFVPVLGQFANNVARYIINKYFKAEKCFKCIALSW